MKFVVGSLFFLMISCHSQNNSPNSEMEKIPIADTVSVQKTQGILDTVAVKRSSCLIKGQIDFNCVDALYPDKIGGVKRITCRDKINMYKKTNPIYKLVFLENGNELSSVLINRENDFYYKTELPLNGLFNGVLFLKIGSNKFREIKRQKVITISDSVQYKYFRVEFN